MKVRVVLILALSWCVMPGTPTCAQTLSAEAVNRQRVAWVADSLERMQTIRPGMTRAALLKVFGTEGGLSNGLRRTYVYRDCPYFKIDVEFEPVGRPPHDKEGRVTLVESGADTIKSISRPYLQFGVAD